MNLVGDEFHIIMKCDKYKDLQVEYLEKISNLEKSCSNLEWQEQNHMYSVSQKKRNQELLMFYHNLITIIINK